ncbi:hypothetical protein ElyMa_003480000 [Elysia marginata]|uniref:Secreted protein n=1 Tax=Elysia marginata TaxID=1093978 RepID=A0AAV4EC37_9GAST|nr:hypothetical protein ElyMa_003480000 [Elysia marginata]
MNCGKRHLSSLNISAFRYLWLLLFLPLLRYTIGATGILYTHAGTRRPSPTATSGRRDKQVPDLRCGGPRPDEHRDGPNSSRPSEGMMELCLPHPQIFVVDTDNY